MSDKPPRTFEFRDRSIPRLEIPPKPKQYDYFDTKTRGLGLRISYGGKRTFFVLYGPAAKRQRHTLGEYGRIEEGRLSLAEARRQAALFDDRAGQPVAGRHQNRGFLSLWQS